MNNIRGLEKKEIIFGLSMFMYFLISLTILVLKPFSADSMKTLATLLTLPAGVTAALFCVRAIRLYGPGTNEGKLWFKLVTMMVVITIGLALSEIMSKKYDPFAFGAIAGFSLICWGIIERIYTAGIKPSKRDYFFGILVLALLDAVIILLSFKFRDDVANIVLAEHFLEILLISIAFFATFLCVLMARQMGGHISQGWYYLTFGACVFAITYTMVVMLRALGHYDNYIWIEAFQIMALSSVTFSAFYQRRRHLKIIEGFT